MDNFTNGVVDSNLGCVSCGYSQFKDLPNSPNNPAYRRVLNKNLPSYAKVQKAWDNYELNPNARNSNGSRYLPIGLAYDNTCSIDSPYVTYKFGQC
jgi:hypothetical protein